MPSLLDALRPLASWTGSAAKAPGLVAIPLVLGAACVLGSAAWVSGSLFAAVDPPREKAAVLSRLDDWPEIRNGVPELKRAAPVPLPAIDAASPSEAGRAAAPGGLPTGRPEAPPMPPEAASVVHEGNAQERPASAAAAAVPAPEADNAGTVPAPSLLSSAPVSAAGGAPPAPRARPSPASVEGGARPAKALGPQRGRGSDRIDAAAPSRPSPSQRAAAPRREGGTATRTADARPTKPERGRTAASPQPSEEAAAPGGSAETAVAAAPEGEGVRLLGVPLPSGRRIKECLLDFRC